jgi:hypothetical protein
MVVAMNWCALAEKNKDHVQLTLAGAATRRRVTAASWRGSRRKYMTTAPGGRQWKHPEHATTKPLFMGYGEILLGIPLAPPAANAEILYRPHRPPGPRRRLNRQP